MKGRKEREMSKKKRKRGRKNKEERLSLLETVVRYILHIITKQ
jgi:hypothetical protein